jgi:hypothetical protein
LNPQHPEPQSGALPLSYDHHAEGKKNLAQVQVQPSRFSMATSRLECDFFPAHRPMEKNCNHAPINYDPELILNREQFSESLHLAEPVEVRCGRTR